MRSRPDLGYRYAGHNVVPVGKNVDEDQAGEELPAVQLPIVHLGQQLGSIVAQKPAGASEWTDHEIKLMEALTDQLSLALDSARLYEAAQRRATRDRLMGQVTARMRETLDLDVVLQTAIQDIGQALNIDEVEVHMGQGPSPSALEAKAGREVTA